MTSAERWALAIAAAGVILNVGLFVGFGLQLRLLRLQIDQAAAATERDHTQRRRQATLEFITATLDRQAELRGRGLPELFERAVSSFTDTPEDLGDTRNEVSRLYLNGYEAFATGVNLGLYDLEVVNALRGSSIVKSWELFRPWIEARRKLFAQPDLYEELEMMANSIVVFRAEHNLSCVELV